MCSYTACFPWQKEYGFWASHFHPSAKATQNRGEINWRCFECLGTVVRIAKDGLSKVRQSGSRLSCEEGFIPLEAVAAITEFSVRMLLRPGKNLSPWNQE